MRPLVILVGALLLIVFLILMIRQALPGLVHSTCTNENNYRQLQECEGLFGFSQYNKTMDQVTGYILGLVVGIVGTVAIVAGTNASRPEMISDELHQEIMDEVIKDGRGSREESGARESNGGRKQGRKWEKEDPRPSRKSKDLRGDNFVIKDFN
jgi:hypothetical protein